MGLAIGALANQKHLQSVPGAIAAALDPSVKNEKFGVSERYQKGRID